ncbi:CDK5RAP1-like protein [Macrosteles quadrilineatus]|uniref:CDK5RAP1-like protein n=1 Tax=Macrosteles quadrilineatus TaxID=74068 RepID=UPI0023E17E75|nr:CDK5RAP1-like protein [Macrosteles quadrilineatus]
MKYWNFQGIICDFCFKNFARPSKMPTVTNRPRPWSMVLSNKYYCVDTKNIKSKLDLSKGPSLNEFIRLGSWNNKVGLITKPIPETIPYTNSSDFHNISLKVYFDVHGCQMNVSDTEIVWSILKSAGFIKTEVLNEADVVLIMTCAIREGAENKIWNKLVNNLKYLKKDRQKQPEKPSLKIGVLGCMAERLKHTLLEKEQSVDLVAGPDSYKDLPRLLALTYNDQTAVNVLLSLDETYADVMPVRLNEGAKSAFVSIMRGCDNMCTYCIVPFTRGRERSRPVQSIVNEVAHLVQQGVREVTLLGQNVNSYQDLSQDSYYMSDQTAETVKGFKTVYKPKKRGLNFAQLLDRVSAIDPNLRVRFTSPHPKDFPDEVLQIIRERRNICRSLHIPAQSGNSSVLERMRRGYSRESYLDLILHIREVLPGVAISSDFICGFCGETEEEFEDTLSLVKLVKYNFAYIFPYSMREKTTAHRRFKDDVPQEIKTLRVDRLVSQFRKDAEQLNKAQIGSVQLILVEGDSKRSKEHLAGRNDGNTKVIVPKVDIPEDSSGPTKPISSGDYVAVKITDASSQVLKGVPLYHSTLERFNQSSEAFKSSTIYG